MGLLVLALGAGGCSLWPFGRNAGPAPDVEKGLALVEEEGVVAFYERAAAFYSRLAQRRFNSLATYRDENLRDYFRTEAAFSDYYADLAEALDDAYFEQNRPVTMEVLEFELEGPGTAKVRSRFVGENGKPLRPGKVAMLREDRWERLEGTWWIIPGKL